MYKLKENPEDFVVEEIPKYNKDDGNYNIFKLTKKGYATVTAIESIANFLRIKSRDIGFAGNKDKQAVTTQYISVKGVPKDRVLKYEREDIKLEFVCPSARPISLGNLEGNRFTIIARDCDKKPEGSEIFINYFGEQRFSKNNVELGKLLLKEKFEEAVALIKEMGLYEKKVEGRIAIDPNDYVGILKVIPQKILTLFVNAYQSYVWNKAVSKMLDSECKIEISGQELSAEGEFSEREVPLIGFETEDEKIMPELQEILDEEGMSQRDFIVKQISYLSVGGSFRKMFAKVNNLSIKELDSKTFELSFDLPKGSYATVVIRQLFKE